jgi:hypothetical protein
MRHKRGKAAYLELCAIRHVCNYTRGTESRDVQIRLIVMVAPEKCAFALGLGTAAGSLGQFLLIPVARGFIESYGWLGGYLFDTTGLYNVVWWATAIIAAITALIHVFIDERPVVRLRQNLAAA